MDAIAIGYQVPADLAVSLALPLITTAVHGRRTVRVTSDWTEVVALASLSALASDERKSPVLKLLRAPLREHEAAAQKNAQSEIAEQTARRGVAEDRADGLRKLAVKPPWTGLGATRSSTSRPPPCHCPCASNPAGSPS
ncbi:MAG: YfjI family protein [Actinomycetota bacterium]|nr:YfjI family protein [Actinomycetota bacterium]